MPTRGVVTIVKAAMIVAIFGCATPLPTQGQAPAAAPAAAVPAVVQGAPVEPPKPAEASKALSAPPEKPLRVVFVKGSTQDDKAWLNESIHVYAENLPESFDASKYVLYINGLAVPGLRVWREDGLPSKPPPDLSLVPRHLKFEVARNKDSDAALTQLSMQAWQTAFDDGFEPKFSIAVGKGNAPPGPTAVQAFPISLINERFFVLFAFAALALLGALIWCGGWTGALRDKIPEKVATSRPFSLARCQMAWWFFLSLVAYMLIYLVTGKLGAFSQAMLGLIGISASTALASVAVDSSKRSQLLAEKDKLLQEQTAAVQPRSDAIGVRLAAIKAQLAPSTVNFMNDVLSDEEDISLNRLQIFVWTIVLGLIFMAQVWQQLAMPEFSGTVLALMGISGGTYVGFKLPTPPA